MLVPYLVVPLQFLLTPPATALYVLDHAEPHPQNHRWPHLLLRPLLPTRRRQAQDCPPSLFGQTRRPHHRHPGRPPASPSSGNRSRRLRRRDRTVRHRPALGGGSLVGFPPPSPAKAGPLDWSISAVGGH